MTTTRVLNRMTTPAPTLLPVTAVDIVGCGLFSAVGRGLEPVAAALGQDAVPPASVVGSPSDDYSWPPLEVRPVVGFDAPEILGRKGLSRMTRTDQLCMAACMMALDEAGIGPRSALTGIVLGTAVGSGSALLRFLRDTFEHERPYLVNPSHFPGTLMNSAAGKTAIRLGLTGVNASVSGGPMAAMHALHYARNALVAGHALRLLAGGVEELSAEGAWAWHRTDALAKDTVLAEGCAMFVLDVPHAAAPVTHHEGASQPHRSRRVLGRLLACEIRFADPANGLLAVSDRLADCIHVALARSGASVKEVGLTAPGAGGRRGWAAVEERALRHVFPKGSVPRRLRVNRVLGETYSAGVALQLAAVLARWQYPAARTEDLAERERVAVLSSVNTEGSVGCLVVAHPDFT